MIPAAAKAVKRLLRPLLSLWFLIAQAAQKVCGYIDILIFQC